MTIFLLTVVLCAVVIGAVVWAIHLDLRDDAERWRWLNEWDERQPVYDDEWLAEYDRSRGYWE